MQFGRSTSGDIHRTIMLLVCVFSTALLLFGPVGEAASRHRLLTNGKVKIAILDPMDMRSPVRHKRDTEDTEQTLSRQKRPSEEHNSDSDTLEKELSRQKRVSEDNNLNSDKHEKELFRQKRVETEEEEAELSRQKRRDVTEELSREKRTFRDFDVSKDEQEPELSRQKRIESEEEELSRQKRHDVTEELSREKRTQQDWLVSADKQETELSRQKRIETDEPELVRQKRRDEADDSSEDDLERELSRIRRLGNENLLSRQKRKGVEYEPVLSRTMNKEEEEELTRVKRTEVSSDVESENAEKSLSRQKRITTDNKDTLSRQKRIEGDSPEDTLSEARESQGQEVVLSRDQRDQKEEKSDNRYPEREHSPSGTKKGDNNTTLSIQLGPEEADNDTSPDNRTADTNIEKKQNFMDAESEEERRAVLAHLQKVTQDTKPMTSIPEPPRHSRQLLQVFEKYPPSETVEEQSVEEILSRQKRELRHNKVQQTKDVEDVLDPDEDIHETELTQERKAELREERRRRRKQQEKEGRQEEEEDGWEQELRIRQELADNNIQIGIERRRERKARAEATGELSLLQRIRQDAQEILRRQAEEKSARESQAREKKNKDVEEDNPARSEKRRNRESFAEEETLTKSESEGFVDPMELLAGKRDKAKNYNDDDDDDDDGDNELATIPYDKDDRESGVEKMTQTGDEGANSRDLLTGHRVGLKRVKRDLENDYDDDLEEEREEVREEEENGQTLTFDSENDDENERRKRKRKNKKQNIGATGNQGSTTDENNSNDEEEEEKTPVTERPLTEVEAAILKFRRHAQSGELYSKKSKNKNNRKKRSKDPKGPVMSRKEREEYYKSIGLPLLSVPGK